MFKIKNANGKPETFYGLHMTQGLAEYAEEGMLLAQNPALLKMNQSFQGCPVFVEHVDDVDYSKVNESDGIVNESFYNKLDGHHWVKFQVFTDEAKDKIAQGWQLSNAYIVNGTGAGGTYHGAHYAKEILEAEYEHLAIVPNPRYAESIILTPEEFKQYNEDKKQELKKLANSKDKPLKEKKGMLNIFKREKVENAADLETMIVSTKAGDLSIVELVKLVNEKEEEKEKPMNEDAMIKVGEEEMKLSELKNKYMSMCKENKKNEEDEEKKKKENEEEDKKKKEEMENKKKNSSDFDKIENADDKDIEEEEIVITLGTAQVEKGKARY